MNFLLLPSKLIDALQFDADAEKILKLARNRESRVRIREELKIRYGIWAYFMAIFLIFYFSAFFFIDVTSTKDLDLSLYLIGDLLLTFWIIFAERFSRIVSSMRVVDTLEKLEVNDSVEDASLLDQWIEERFVVSRQNFIWLCCIIFFATIFAFLYFI